MDISIITPVYKGNKYLNNYIDKVDKACKQKENVEVIFVNDSPSIQLEFDEKKVKNFDLKIIENEKNQGIQMSRINGLKEARGKYILFLDQDDEITEDCLISQFNIAEEKDLDFILGNGYFEDKKGMHLIFNNKFSQRFATKKNVYIKARDFIVSPGQCLIKKNSIPEEWKNNIIKANGTDDYLLWLLMFNNKIKIGCNYKTIYIHKYTGENYSTDLEKMYESQLELLKILKSINYNKKDYKTLERTFKFKHLYKKEFMKQAFKNFDILVFNIYYRSVWRGYVYKDEYKKR